MVPASSLKNLLVAALLSFVLAHAADAISVASEDAQTARSFKVSDLRCDVVGGQVRCTFGG